MAWSKNSTSTAAALKSASRSSVVPHRSNWSSSRSSASSKRMASGEKFERHRQPWRQDEIQKLHLLAGKGMALEAIAKALTRSEESVKERAKNDRLKIAKLR